MRFSLFILLAFTLAGCGTTPYAPTQPVTTMKSRLSVDQATTVIAKAMTRSEYNKGLCQTSYTRFDDRTTVSASQGGVSFRAFKLGEKLGEESGKVSRTVYYRKRYYTETVRFSDIRKVLITFTHNGVACTSIASDDRIVMMYVGATRWVATRVKPAQFDEYIAALMRATPKAKFTIAASLQK